MKNGNFSDILSFFSFNCTLQLCFDRVHFDSIHILLFSSFNEYFSTIYSSFSLLLPFVVVDAHSVTFHVGFLFSAPCTLGTIRSSIARNSLIKSTTATFLILFHGMHLKINVNYSIFFFYLLFPLGLTSWSPCKV